MVLALVGAPYEGSLLAESKPLRSACLAPCAAPSCSSRRCARHRSPHAWRGPGALSRGKAGDAEGRDWKVGSAGADQLCHQRAEAGPELEAVPAEAKLVIDPLGRRARSDDGDVVGHACLDPGPCAHNTGAVHGGEQLPDGAGTLC